jgi:hypothetical protein
MPLSTLMKQTMQFISKYNREVCKDCRLEMCVDVNVTKTISVKKNWYMYNFSFGKEGREKMWKLHRLAIQALNILHILKPSKCQLIINSCSLL